MHVEMVRRVRVLPVARPVPYVRVSAADFNVGIGETYKEEHDSLLGVRAVRCAVRTEWLNLTGKCLPLRVVGLGGCAARRFLVIAIDTVKANNVMVGVTIIWPVAIAVGHGIDEGRCLKLTRA